MLLSLLLNGGSFVLFVLGDDDEISVSFFFLDL